jgi:integrase/recombinase XerD
VLRFQEKGGKSREIPVRHDLEGHIRDYLDAAGIGAENKDRPLFRSREDKTMRLTGNPLTCFRRFAPGVTTAFHLPSDGACAGFSML